MENIAQNKLKFFAQYFGQKVLKNDKYQELSFVSGFFFFHNATYIENYHLELRDINSITDEECVEYYDLKYPDSAYYWSFEKKIGIIKSHDLYSFITSNKPIKESYFLIDFLRSKGFLVPFMNLTTDQILEFGWAKIKDNEQTKAE